MKSNWIIKKIDHSRVIENSKIIDLNKLILSLLYSRGIKTPEEIENFIHPRLSTIHSPFIMNGIYDATARIRKAVDNNEKIGIFSDSDLDGLTSLTILYNLFLRINIKPYCRYPQKDETYGLTNKIIDEFRDNKVKIIITADSGIRDVKEIDYASTLGIEIIVTDHHEQDEILPDAIIVNPKQNKCEYPFKHLAGVGVTFKLCHALLMSYLPAYNQRFVIITEDKKRIYISYIKNGIIENIMNTSSPEEVDGIISSLNDNDNIILYDANEIKKICSNKFTNKKIYNVSNFVNLLVGEDKQADNFSIEELCRLFSIKKCLYNKIELLNTIFLEIQLQSSPKIFDFINSIIGFVSIGSIADIVPLVGENRVLVHHGINSLNTTSHAGLSLLTKNEKINSKKIGWDIAPLLNTPGRYGKTELTADFFLENDVEKLYSIINTIKSMNEERKKLVSELYKKLMHEVNNDKDRFNDKLIHISADEIPDGLAGLLANRLADSINKPVIVTVLPAKNGLIKGSGRSRGDFNFFKYVKPFSDMFDKIGGHPQAFGFTAELTQIDDIIQNINLAIEKYYTSDESITIDLEIDVDTISVDMIKNLSIFEPIGKDNEEPVFLSRNINIDNFTRFGNNDNHGRYIIKKNISLNAIGWNIADKMEEFFRKEKMLDIVYSLEINEFRNVISPQMVIQDIHTTD